jgi:hypothetical protein
MEMELGTKAGFEELIRMLIATKDNAKIMEIYKDLILRSYGIKSEDGRRFIKTKELRDEFEQSEAYSELLMELLSSEDAQSEFINKIINGVNIPNQDPQEAINKLKALGYDTTAFEKSNADVIPLDNKTVDNGK